MSGTPSVHCFKVKMLGGPVCESLNAASQSMRTCRHRMLVMCVTSVVQCFMVKQAVLSMNAASQDVMACNVDVECKSCV